MANSATLTLPGGSFRYLNERFSVAFAPTLDAGVEVMGISPYISANGVLAHSGSHSMTKPLPSDRSWDMVIYAAPKPSTDRDGQSVLLDIGATIQLSDGTTLNPVVTVLIREPTSEGAVMFDDIQNSGLVPAVLP